MKYPKPPIDELNTVIKFIEDTGGRKQNPLLIPLLEDIRKIFKKVQRKQKIKNV